MSTAFLVAIFGGGSVCGIIVAILNGFFLKRRTKAEAAELIQRAASGLTTSVTGELERMAKSHAADRDEWRRDKVSMIQTHETDRATWLRERGEWRAALQLHAAWDAIVYSQIREAGIDVPEPPPLLPPHL